MTKQEMQVRLSVLRQQLREVRGTPCEVYSRVVGYLRPVQGWNKGKQEEFNLRAQFCVECK